MICKIQPPNPNINAAINYNEKKMNGAEGIRPHKGDPELEAIEDGHVLATRNVPVGSSFTEEMARLKWNATKKRRSGPAIKNVTFHMSVNPSETDRELSEEEAVRLADDIMQGMDYGGQPYRIYKHTDIAREHYHIVSSRIGRDGKKIDASFERLKLRKLLKELSKKYGFELVLNETEMEAEALKNEKKRKKERTARKDEPFTMPETPARVKRQKRNEPEKPEDGETPAPSKDENPEKDSKARVPAFSRRSETPVLEQMRTIYEETMTWHFSTFEQIQALLIRRFNLLIELEDDGDEGRVLLFGADATGKPVTPPINEDQLGIPMLRQMKDRIAASEMPSRKSQKRRLEQLSRAAMDASSSYEEFCRIMEKKGVYVVVSWSRDGQPFGVTYVDRATKCIWKGSETKSDLAWLKGECESRGWNITMDRFQENVEKRNRAKTRRTTLRTSDKTTATPDGQRPLSPSARPKHVNTERSRRSNATAGKRGDDIWEDEVERLRREMEM